MNKPLIQTALNNILQVVHQLEELRDREYESAEFEETYDELSEMMNGLQCSYEWIVSELGGMGE